MSNWQPIDTAPKDGTSVLLKVKSIVPDFEDVKSVYWSGIFFVGHNNGDVSDWIFSAPVGVGGIPDRWIEGWMPIPE